eukprot:3487962-Rhodomonas_salina.2
MCIRDRHCPSGTGPAHLSASEVRCGVLTLGWVVRWQERCRVQGSGYAGVEVAVLPWTGQALTGLDLSLPWTGQALNRL